VAEGNQLGSALGRHDAGHARRAEHISFRQIAGLEQAQRLRLHQDAAGRNRLALSLGLRADVNYMGLALGVKVNQLLHACILIETGQ
jgi:hypothetical protein